MKTLILKLIIINVISVSIRNTAHSQISKEWERSFSISANNSQVVNDITSDTDGNIYVTGYNAAGYSESDMVTLKYSSSGEFKWAKIYYNPNIRYCQEKGKYLAAYSNAGNNFIYAAGEVNTGVHNQYLVLIKYDGNGNQLWIRTMYLINFGFNHKLKKITADGSGNVYLTGGNSDRAFLVKYDSAGNQKFEQKFTNPSGFTIGQGNDVKVSSAGEIIVSGQLKNGSGQSVPFILKADTSGNVVFYKHLTNYTVTDENESKVIVTPSGKIYSGCRGNTDYILLKYDTYGDTVWSRRYNGSANGQDYFNAAAIDNEENVYMTGRVNGIYGDIGTVKFDSSGNQIWSRTAAGQGGWADEGRDIETDASGNIFVAGLIDNSVSGKCITIKYDPAGTLLWSKEYDFAPGDYEETIALTVDVNGNAISTGNCGYVTVSDFATVKYNSSGSLQWAKKFNAAQISTDKINSIATDKNGNIYAVGRVRTGQSGDNIQIVKYNSSGVKKWEVSRGGTNTSEDMEDAGYAVTVDNNGNVYFTGTMHVNTTSNKRDVYTGKLDSNGNNLWAYPFGFFFGAGGNDEGVEIEADTAGNIYVGYNSEITPGNIKFGVRKYTSSGSLIWGNGYTSAVNDTDRLREMKIDKDGNVYLLGSCRGVSTGFDIVTMKINADGSHAWQQTHNGTADGNDDARSMDIDAEGNVYVTGSSLNTATGNDICVLKYTGSGALAWLFQKSAGTEMKESGGVVKYDSISKLIKTACDIRYSLHNTLAKYELNLDSAGNIYSEIISNPATKNNFVSGGTLDASGQLLSSSYRETDISGTDVRMSRSLINFIDYNGAYSGNDLPAVNESVSASGNYFYAGVTAFDSLKGNVMTIVKYKSPVYTLNMNLFIEGFYNSSSGYMVSDTVKVTLRNSASPYAIADTSKTVCSFEGNAYGLHFYNITGNNSYFISLTHRNSVETWSKTLLNFGPGFLNVNFKDTANVFGNNLIKVSSQYDSKFCVYSGDINQDGTIDITDCSLADNDALNFASGYLPTDVNGDGITDVADAVYTDNNAFNFVGKITP